MKEPTEEQIKEFWEWCGFKRKLSASENPHYWTYYSDEIGLISRNDLPPIDLNNLAKWAVPKLIKDTATELEIHFDYLPSHNKWNCQLGLGFYEREESKYNLAVATGDTLVLSFFWAIYKVMEKK